MKVGENTAVPEPPSPEQMMAQMAALVDQVAAMQVEILQLRGTNKAKDEDSLALHRQSPFRGSSPQKPLQQMTQVPQQFQRHSS